MFSDKYKSDNEKIAPEEALVKHLAYKMKNDENLNKEPSAPWYKSAWIGRAAAIAVCLAVTAAGIGINSMLNGGGVTFSGGKGNDNASITPYVQGSAPVMEPVAAYDALYSAINDMQSTQYFGYAEDGVIDMEGSIIGALEKAPATGTDQKSAQAPADSAATRESAGAAADSDYSGTNIQVEGVDEADIVKTDGKYIYAIRNQQLIIVEAEGADSRLVSRTDLSSASAAGFSETDYINNMDMYVRGDRLIIMTAVDNAIIYPARAYDTGYASDPVTYAVVYDISRRENPKEISKTGQSGNLLSSRLVGDILYLTTNHYINNNVNKNNVETYVPAQYRGDERCIMPAGDIYINPNPISAQYLIVSALDVRNPDEFVSSKSVLGCGSTMYSSTKNLLIASEYYDNGATDETRKSGTTENLTNLFRFSLDGGNVELSATGRVAGTLLNQFSMDESGGYFRIVTTAQRNSYSTDGYASSFTPGDTYNNLYVLDMELKIAGRIENLAKGERVYSVRFDGDVGYFVTFRQVDPLFTVDLKDPADPKILSELKIPGFSEYLHPFGDGLLFGLGRDADSQGVVKGDKLSMFDVSDPANVSEAGKTTLTNSWSSAAYNHKSILISAERNIIAFPGDNYYFVYSYSKDSGFKQLAKLKLKDYSDSYDARCLYIGDVFYVVMGTNIEAFSISDFKSLSVTKFK